MKNNILKYLYGYKKEAILGPLFKLLEAIFELIVPIIVADIIDNGNTFNYVFIRFLILFALALIGLVCSITAQYFSAKAAVCFSSKVRQVLFDKIQYLDFYGLDEEGTSTLINRMTNDVNQVQTGVNLVLRLFLRSPFVVFGAMIMAFTISVKIAYIFILAIIILSLIVFGIMLISIPLYKKVQSKSDKLLSLTRENLIGVRVLRAFNQEETERNNYEKHNKSLTKEQKFVGNISQAMNPLTYVCINFMIILLIKMGAVEVNTGNLSQGNVIALYNYMSQILVELIKLANLIIQLTKAFASKHRIESILDTQNTLIEKDIQNNFDESKPIISFKNVSMRYPKNKQDSLSNISFDIYQGQTLGIIGGTGSGKSTLVSLIPHFYDATSGGVEYKGINVQNIDSALLRDKIGIVMQKGTVFSGTIKENLLIGKSDATEEEIIKVLKDSQSYDFVFSKKEGINYLVEQNGRNLSGGQIQRLSIARALIKKPDILIFDDSQSALDYKTDSLLRQALKELSYNPTQIIVSQRTSSIMHADKIIVLDNGNMVGYGTHDELMQNCKIYQEIYHSQYKGGAK